MINLIKKYTLDQWLLLFSQFVAHVSIIPMIIYGSWQQWAIAFFVYFITGCFGMTMTYHRLLSHNSWNAPKWYEYFGTLCGFYGLINDFFGSRNRRFGTPNNGFGMGTPCFRT